MSEIKENDTIIEVDIHQIRVSPFQPRKVFTEEELEDLATSIRSVGLIHPPVVRAILSGKHILYYELIAGERRWRAMQHAGYQTMPVILKHSLSDDTAAEATLIENIQRVDLNPMEMAEAFKKLIDVFGLTQDKVAAKVGKKRSTVANYLRLLSLPDAIRAHIHTGKVTLGHAKVILSLEDPALRVALSNRIVERQLAVRETEREAKLLSQKGASNKGTKLASQDSQLQHLEQKLSQKSQCRVKIQRQGDGYSVAFYVPNSEELDRFLALNF